MRSRKRKELNRGFYSRRPSARADHILNIPDSYRDFAINPISGMGPAQMHRLSPYIQRLSAITIHPYARTIRSCTKATQLIRNESPEDEYNGS